LGFRIGQSSGECDVAISLYPVDWPFTIVKVLTGEHPATACGIIMWPYKVASTST
jgi:hypothetical protein